MIEHSERLIAIVGPSGAGKDSVLKAWRAVLAAESPRPLLHFPQRSITRPSEPDGGEQHEPLSEAEFKALLEAQAFALHWQANGLCYGIRHKALEPLKGGAWVVVNASREHLPVFKAAAPKVRIVEITAPPEVLAQRLANRGREDAAMVQQRLERARAMNVEADLRIENTGDIHDAARRLHDWWRSS